MANSRENEQAGAALRRSRIEAALSEILASASFRSTQQCQSLLQYVIAHTLSGEDEMLRERVVGHEVFGRPAAYEPGDDPVVRIRAADVRKRLAIYYQSLATPPDVRIEIPSGSYRAVFTFADHSLILTEPQPETSEGLASGEPVLVTLPEPAPAQHSLWPRLALWAVPILLLALAIAIYPSIPSRNQRALQAMWGPFASGKMPVLLSMGSNAVYRMSESASDTYSQTHNLASSGMEFYPAFSPSQTLDSTGLQPSPGSFVAEGDVAANAAIVAVLTRLHQTTEERFPTNISFAEVQATPSVLIGGFNNPMSLEITRPLRFTLAARRRIEDHQKPGRYWVLSASSDARDTQDYALVTRIISHGGEAPQMALEGLGQYGTLAAARFVSDPEAIRSLSRIVGPDWAQHNLQLVLSIKVIDYRPSATEVVGATTW